MEQIMNYEQAQAAIDTAFPRVNAGIRRFWVGALVSEHQRSGTTAEEFVARLKKSRAESAAKERTLRAALSEKYGSGKYKITVADEVHAHGYMPNSSQYGWYLVGTTESVLRDIENGWF